MRFICLFLLIALLPVAVLAQGGTITGKVMSADLQMPLAKASVFLSNATFGTSTAGDGTFTMQNVKPGQYELVVTYVGYESYHKTILVGATPIDLKIEMSLKTRDLQAVNIVRHPFSKENFAKFVTYFLGTSDNAKKCRILNPTAIDLYYHPFEKKLVGRADEFIQIENKSLGYKIKYLLSEFVLDNINETVSYGGSYQFEDMKGSKRQVEIWRKKREDAYYGSSMHFFRSLRKNALDSDGFVIHRLVRIPNPERPPQVVIVKNIDRFNALNMVDSANHWIDLANLKRYQENMINPPLLGMEILRHTDEPGVFGVVFPNCLYVTYTRKYDNDGKSRIYRPLNMPPYMTTIVTLYQPFALFDMNGVVMSQEGKSSVLFEGAWSNDKVADLLPVDYAPADRK